MTNDGKTRLIFTHNTSNPPIHKWVREAQQLLVRNDKAKALGKNIQVTSRQPRNLQRMVTGIQRGVGNPPHLMLAAINVANVKCLAPF